MQARGPVQRTHADDEDQDQDQDDDLEARPGRAPSGHRLDRLCGDRVLCPSAVLRAQADARHVSTTGTAHSYPAFFCGETRGGGA